VPTATITAQLLHFARHDVEAKLAHNAYSDVPAPAGAPATNDSLRCTPCSTTSPRGTPRCSVSASGWPPSR
jgi:hypothetical protein